MRVLFYATVAMSGWRVARYFIGRLFSRDRDGRPSRVRGAAKKAPSREVERWENEGGMPA